MIDITNNIPSIATPAEAATMQAWLRQNEICRGAPKSTPSSPACRARDRLQAKARAAGWCWAFRDVTVLPADYHWHLCSRESLTSAQRGYETAVQPINARIATLTAMTQCGLIRVSTYNYWSRELERERLGRAGGQFLAHMTDRERSAAFAFDRRFVRYRLHQMIGDKPDRARCAKLANSPNAKQFADL